MKLIPRPLSFSAYQAWQKNVNQYLLYRLGYVSRVPALHHGIDVHQRVADVFMGRTDSETPIDDIALLCSHITSRYNVVGVEVSMTIDDPFMRGVVDLILVNDNDLVIADIKTGRPYPYHIDQLHWYFTIFRHLPISGGLLIYLGKDHSVRSETVEIDDDKLAEIRLAVSEAQYNISRQVIPPEVVIPIHGVSFVDRDNFDLLDKGQAVRIQREWVETEDRGTVWGLRVFYQDEPIGWLPDSLKERILATEATIFAARGDTDRKFGYVRVHIPSDKVVWDGIAV